MSNGTLKDVFELISFTTHLGLEHASSDDDESPWIRPSEMAYPSPSGALVKSNACMICIASFSGLVRLVVK